MKRADQRGERPGTGLPQASTRKLNVPVDQRRPGTCSASSSRAHPCPSTPERDAPPPQFDISAITTVSSSHGTHARSFSSRDVRRAELEKYESEQERLARDAEFAEMRALIALAESQFAQKTPSSSELKKQQILKAVREIEELVNLCDTSSLLIELQQTVDARRKLLDSAELPTDEQNAIINELMKNLKDTLKLKGVALGSAEELGKSLDTAASASIPDYQGFIGFIEDVDQLKRELAQHNKAADELESLLSQLSETSQRLNFLRKAVELDRMIKGQGDVTAINGL